MRETRLELREQPGAGGEASNKPNSLKEGTSVNWGSIYRHISQTFTTPREASNCLVIEATAAWIEGFKEFGYLALQTS